MTIHQTLEAARAAAKDINGAAYIMEIEHATQGNCYIVAKCNLACLKAAMQRSPLPEISRLIAQHDLLTAAEISEQRTSALRERTTCERCQAKIDGNTAYNQQELYRGTKVIAYYCESCRHLLTQIGLGEYTDLQARGSEGGSREPYTKSDF